MSLALSSEYRVRYQSNDLGKTSDYTNNLTGTLTRGGKKSLTSFACQHKRTSTVIMNGEL